MQKKQKYRGVVYSTDPDFVYEEDSAPEEETLDPAGQKLVIRLDKKQRKGKKVTLVEGFVGNMEDLKELGKILKSKCGAGGAVKDGLILIQGDFREKVQSELLKMNYRCKRIG